MPDPVDQRPAPMPLAIASARASIAAGQSPFGSVIVRSSSGEVVATGHNHVWAWTDPTAHAEVVCIRNASRMLGTIDLRGCELFSTCEPCPMCASAIHWANLDAVHFGARIADAEAAGFRELTLPIETIYREGKSGVCIHADVMRDECAALFREWQDANGRAY